MTEFETIHHYVRCSSCGGYHDTDDITIDNVEEDEIGRDRVTFTCPVTNEYSKSLVWIGRAPE